MIIQGRTSGTRRTRRTFDFQEELSEGFALEIYLIVFGRSLDVSLKIAELNI